MALHRFYCSYLTGSVTKLDSAESHHLADVLRLGRGDKVELFDGKGSLATALVKTVNSKK